MNVTRSRIKCIAALTVAMLLTGCEQPQPPARPEAPVANSQTVSPSPTSTATPSTATTTPITLPLLDAILADEKFAGDAKGAIGLTDEELQKVKDAARNDVLQLTEEDLDPERSTSAAVEKAEKEILQILGAEKGQRFLDLVKQRLATESSSLPTATPNEVPPDTRIVVNAPAYRMDIFKDGQLVKTYKIGVGYPEFPLPSGLRKASSMIFNPTWTPPDEPWVKGKFEPYKKVEAGSKDNPLGTIKIPIGLPSLIHGGKSAARLGTFASHGCVGLTNQQVEDFALQLAQISATELDRRKMAAILREKDQTRVIDLSEPIPVELRYETIVVENGKLKIFRDIYEHGTNTEENLRRVLDHYGVVLDDMDTQLKTAIIAGLDQMARDARGRPVDTQPEPRKKNGAVTKTAKGKTMVEFTVPSLAGKGYPQPVNMKQ